MSNVEREIAAPPINPENQAYFDAAVQGILLIGQCDACGEPHFYPRALCPHCFSERTRWVPAKGNGTLYSFSTLQRGAPAPYTIAYVTLDEGVSMMTNIVDCDVSKLTIGQRLRVVFKQAQGGANVPMFTLA